ncbi:hypothetical protein UR09_02225 [Candidatus Nitromaritima sp. SCGC AAA799-A02]|nr:hypothetical protein UZ36_06490 [Candidatus Nitromaritima sp. SCGC AAA799-C22]KMP11906.1 hypothetical protein UR09_02225 [Candidatus Nitromaritima sp. SCGC AAA799-A02]
MNIVLIGYRGTGKSVLSRILAENLRYERYSLDEWIVRSAGQPIPEIVEQWGWDRFREIEREVVKEVSAQARSAVIDCGGGVVLDERNVSDLKRDGKVVFLTADPGLILKRTGRDTNRPPLKEGLSFEEEQRRILSEREPKYRAAADCTFDTTHDRPRETAEKIIELFKKNRWLATE